MKICTKTRYETRTQARAALTDIWADVQQALEHLRRTGKVPKRTYRCSCGGWHLTSQERPA